MLVPSAAAIERFRLHFNARFGVRVLEKGRAVVLTSVSHVRISIGGMLWWRASLYYEPQLRTARKYTC